MARKGWDSLSPSYRQRLERGGITRASYASGASIKAARGHAHTPETPRQAERHPSLFPRYQSHRQAIINAIYASKQAKYGSSPKWNGTRARQAIDKDLTGNQRSVEELRRIAQIILDAEDNDIFSALSDEGIEDAGYYH